MSMMALHNASDEATSVGRLSPVRNQGVSPALS